MRLNEKGFTLVQTMISVGLAGLLAVVLLKSQESSFLSKTKAQDDQTLNEVIKKIQNALKDKATCSYSLQGKRSGDEVIQFTEAQINPNNFNNYIPKRLDNNPTQNLVLIQSNRPMAQDVLISKMTLVQVNNLDYLSVEFDLDPKDRKKTVGGKTITKLFPLRVTKNAGATVSCYSETDDLLTLSLNFFCKWIPSFF
jgi:Tfp pilus assembly protein PilE